MTGEVALLDVVRGEFGLPARGMTVGGRGALGEIWRLHIDGGADLAVKVLAKQPSEPSVAVEVAHTRELIRRGVRVAASIPNRHGRYVSPGPGGWLRVSEWINGGRPDPADPLTPSRLGDALGRMHANAVPTPHELDGRAPDAWYHQPPDTATLGSLLAAAESSDPRWAGRLHAFMPTLHSLSGITKTPASLVLCHRDLHPENVLLTPDGQFAVLDWDNLGPADPTQELASVLLHWFADHTGVRGPLIKPFIEAYRSNGGTGTLTGIGDFAMHLAASLNFLALQLAAVADPRTETADVQRAVMETEESLRLLPTTDVLTQSLDWSIR